MTFSRLLVLVSSSLLAIAVALNEVDGWGAWAAVLGLLGLAGLALHAGTAIGAMSKGDGDE